MFLLLVGGDEDHLQLLPVLGALLEAAVELTQATVELLTWCVQAAAEKEPEQRHSGAQGANVHLGFLTVDEPLPEQTLQELRHDEARRRRHFRRKKKKKKRPGGGV